jgi:hypothetical protein
MSNPSTQGGLLKVPAGVPDDHVLLRDGSFAARDSLKRDDPRLQLYAGGECVMLASGQIVPLIAIPE